MSPLDEKIEKKDLAFQLCKIYGFDLAILEGMDLKALKEIARVSGENLAKIPDRSTPDADEPADTGNAEMPQAEKVRKAVAYYDKNSPPLAALGYTRSKFAEIFGRAPKKTIQRLR